MVTDVWISTASILNLCAISVDRYVAVTRPVKYRSIMTPRRAKTIVAFVWVISFLICFPPLLSQWNPSSSTLDNNNNNQHSTATNTTSTRQTIVHSPEHIRIRRHSEQLTDAAAAAQIDDTLAARNGAAFEVDRPEMTPTSSRAKRQDKSLEMMGKLADGAQFTDSFPTKQ